MYPYKELSLLFVKRGRFGTTVPTTASRTGRKPGDRVIQGIACCMSMGASRPKFWNEAVPPLDLGPPEGQAGSLQHQLVWWVIPVDWALTGEAIWERAGVCVGRTRLCTSCTLILKHALGRPGLGLAGGCWAKIRVRQWLAWGSGACTRLCARSDGYGLGSRPCTLMYTQVCVSFNNKIHPTDGVESVPATRSVSGARCDEQDL